jgi:hypothetical protein
VFVKNKKVIIFVVFLMILSALSSYAETKKLERIGQYTFARVRGKIPTPEVMKMLVDRYAADIKYGFDLAGYGDLYLPFLEQLKAASFEERALPVGDKLIWMLFRAQNKVKLVQDIEWAGKEPLEVFVFNVTKDYKKYEFVMPRPCGNIALRYERLPARQVHGSRSHRARWSQDHGAHLNSGISQVADEL